MENTKKQIGVASISETNNVPAPISEAKKKVGTPSLHHRPRKEADRMKCTLCKDTGLLPLKRKDGSTVPFAWINCEECHQSEPVERYIPVKEGYIDFAMSETWREFYDETLYGRIPERGKMIPEKVTNVSDRVTPPTSELTHIRTLLTETRDDQQAHFKHHSGIDKKRKSHKYS